MAIDINDLTRPRIDQRLVLLSLFSSLLGGACLGAMMLTFPSSMPKDTIILSLFLGMTMHGILGLYAFVRSRVPGACIFVCFVVVIIGAATPRVAANSTCNRANALTCYMVERISDARELDRRACLKDSDAKACGRAIDYDGGHAAAYCQTWIALDGRDSSEAHRRCDHTLASSLETTQARIASLQSSVDAKDDVSSNSVAWLLATSPHAGVRDGELAIRYSKQSLEKRPNEPLYIDTLAAAYAEVGRYDDAVATQRRALALLSSYEPRGDYELRLDLYEAHKPARD